MDCIYKNIKKDIYILPSSSNGICIYYSPLRDSSFGFSTNFLDEVIDFYEKSILPKDETLKEYLISIEEQPIGEPAYMKEIDTEDRAVILLTQKCNLSCKYCFAQNSRSSSILSIDKVFAVIDHLFSYNNNKSKGVSFLGGGEPLICWDSIQRAVEYILKKSKETQIPCKISIVTNATLLSEQKVKWLSQNNIIISVSSDILPDIQNIQRPYAFKKAGSFDNVDEGIKLLIKHRVPFKLRATITHLNVTRMSEMVRFVHNNYPALKILHLEPVTDSEEEYEDFFAKYTTYFLEAYQLGQSWGIQVTNSLSSSLFHLKRHFCQGELCVTPTGDIVSCHRHSSKEDEFYEACRYGVIEDDVNIDYNALEDVITMRQNRTEDCDECFAKWHCAGGCASQKMVFSQRQQISFCKYVRMFIRNLLEAQINNSSN